MNSALRKAGYILICGFLGVSILSWASISLTEQPSQYLSSPVEMNPASPTVSPSALPSSLVDAPDPLDIPVPPTNIIDSPTCDWYRRLLLEARNASFPRRISFMHIPKTGGVSIVTEMKRRLPSQVQFARASPGNDEVCLFEAQRDHCPIGTLIREPASHVLSQYLQCAYGPWPGTALPAAFPRDSSENATAGWVPAGNTWLRHFAPSEGSRACWSCYDPWDMRTRHLHCTKNGHCYVPVQADFNQTKQQLSNLWFVGIHEQFDLSLCVMEFQLTGLISPFCQEGGPSREEPPQHADHGVPHHSLHVRSQETLDLIEPLIQRDRALHEYAQSIFEQRVQEIERCSQTRFKRDYRGS